MSSHDDPEDRIRQLEQSAASYGAVELGADQYSSPAADPTAQLPPPVYGAPPPTYGPPPAYGAPPVYGDTYASPPFGVAYPQVHKKGAPLGLIFGAIAVLVVAIFGVVAIVAWNVVGSSGSISTESGGETIYGSPDGSFDEPDSPPSVLPSFPNLPGFGDKEADSAPAGGDFSVSGIDENKTVACNDARISISGVNNTVFLTGHCASVTVSGVENKVTVDNADVISASGFDNRVIYRSGDPQIDNFGGSNTVERG